MKGLVILVMLAGCKPHSIETTTYRVVKDTLVVSKAIQADTVFHCGDTVQIDTGRLAIRLIPNTLGYSGSFQCLPDTIRVPKVVREYTLKTVGKTKKGFWHYSGKVLWLVLILITIIISIRKLI